METESNVEVCPSSKHAKISSMQLILLWNAYFGVIFSFKQLINLLYKRNVLVAITGNVALLKCFIIISAKTSFKIKKNNAYII